MQKTSKFEGDLNTLVADAVAAADHDPERMADIIHSLSTVLAVTIYAATEKAPEYRDTLAKMTATSLMVALSEPLLPTAH